MKKLTATRSLTVSPERRSLSFGSCCDVSGTEFATKRDLLEAGRSSSELDRSAVGTQPGMVLPRLLRHLRSGGVHRISVKAQAGYGSGICGESLAAVGIVRHPAGRQQRSLRADIPSRFAESLCPAGIAGRSQPRFYPQARTVVQRFHPTLQRLAAGTTPGHTLECCCSGPAGTECNDGHLFSRTYLSQSGFSDHRPDPKNPSPRTLPRNFRRHLEPLPVAIGRVTSIRRVRSSERITMLSVKFKFGKRLAYQYLSAMLYTRTMLLKVHSHGRLIKRVQLSVHRQAQTVSNHLVGIFSEVSSALTWRMTLSV